MTLKVLPTSCSYCNSEEGSVKLSIPKMKPKRIDTSFPVQVL